MNQSAFDEIRAIHDRHISTNTQWQKDLEEFNKLLRAEGFSMGVTRTIEAIRSTWKDGMTKDEFIRAVKDWMNDENNRWKDWGYGRRTDLG